MQYNIRVNMEYIRARIRHYNNFRRRPAGLIGKVLAEVEARGALLSETQENG